MAIKGLEALVLGGGIGGLTAALCLDRAGASVRVIEQAPELREVGAGLQISPNGLCVLDALGLGDALRRVALRAEAVQLIDYTGRAVVRLPLTAPGQGAYLLCHRADLLAVLTDALGEADIEICLGQAVSDLRPGSPADMVTETAQTFSAPLIVAADGLHSVARPVLNPDTEGFFTGQVAWRALVPEPDATPHAAHEVRVFMGPRRHLVSYPLRDGRLRNIVAVQERAAWAKESWSQKDDPMHLRQVFDDFGPEVTGLLSRVNEVHLWGLFRHPVAARWHGGGVALLGDAAHPTLPFLAQGANMAIEDAWVLAAELDRAGDLDAGLVAYQARRARRAQRIVEAASRNAQKYHLSFPPIRWGAHAALRLAGRFAPKRVIAQYDWLYRHDVTA
ncbi:MAG: FAD-dependent monooxygenase [Pseudomonadota bacterium]